MELRVPQLVQFVKLVSKFFNQEFIHGIACPQLVQFVKFVSNFFNQEFIHGTACPSISVIRGISV
jgi:hypothetical protein